MKYTDPDGREVTPAVPFVLGSEAVGTLGTALAGTLIELAPAAVPCPTPEPDPNDNDDGEDYTQSAKDAKKIDKNSEANKFARDNGYKDAHELKKDYVGKNNISKFDIYRNTKTGESFLINKTGTEIILIE